MRIAVPLPASVAVRDVYFYPERSGIIDHAAPQVMTRSGDQLILAMPAAAVPTPGPVSGVLSIAAVTMAGAIRQISIEHGLDPRDFVLFCYGGGGPLHSASLAHELAIPKIVIPPEPGNFSAVGMLLADARLDLSKTFVATLNERSLATCFGIFAELEREAQETIRKEFGSGDIYSHHHAEMRYKGQQHSIKVLLSGLKSAAAVRAAFDHEEPAVAIIKHANPCGIAIATPGAADPIADAHARAHLCDPLSAFGGVVAANREKYGTAKIRFERGDATRIDALPHYDLLLCKDVLQHLSNANVRAFLGKIDRSACVLITNDYHPANDDCGDGSTRPLDIARPPFDFPARPVLTFGGKVSFCNR